GLGRTSTRGSGRLGGGELASQLHAESAPSPHPVTPSTGSMRFRGNSGGRVDPFAATRTHGSSGLHQSPSGNTSPMRRLNSTFSAGLASPPGGGPGRMSIQPSSGPFPGHAPSNSSLTGVGAAGVGELCSTSRGETVAAMERKQALGGHGNPPPTKQQRPFFAEGYASDGRLAGESDSL
ncbi:unnamed protein product, partial [Discosporangium mesarthrocarpum]